MKKYIVPVVLLSFVVLLWAQQETPEPEKKKEKGFEEGLYDGKIAGEQVNQSSWIMYGCGGGCLLSVLGGSIVYVMANKGDMPPHVPAGSTAYKQGYVEGYKLGTKGKKRLSAFIGGIGGTLIAVGVILFLRSVPREAWLRI